MGHWGFGYEESDTYLDILDSVFDPIVKIIEADEYYLNEYVAASGILLDLLLNRKLRYSPNMDLVETAITNLIGIANEGDLSDWNPNQESRKESILLLIKDLKKLHKKESRSTSLFDKMMADNK